MIVIAIAEFIRLISISTLLTESPEIEGQKSKNRYLAGIANPKNGGFHIQKPAIDIHLFQGPRRDG